MSRRRAMQAVLLFSAVFLPILTSLSAAYEVQTHETISLEAVNRSSIDDSIRDSLGLTGGAGTAVRGKSLIDWIGEGSIREDDFTRFFNHFHNPLIEDWNQAGFLGTLSHSAIVWGQEAQGTFPSWSWLDARAFFQSALTAAQKQERDRALSQTFEALGHELHLIQDMGSPAHTRNDSHVAYNYEKLVRDVQAREETTFRGWLTATSLTPDPAWQSWAPGAPNGLAPIPIARLFDTDRYRAPSPNPDLTIQPLIGLSEYTQANFFSEGSIFAQNRFNPLDRFPFPACSSVSEADYEIKIGGPAVQTVTRSYFRKDKDGDVGYRLATVPFLRDDLIRNSLDPCRSNETAALDDAVYRDYAVRLVPQAVSYSAAMLDYFFRGRLEPVFTANPAAPATSLMKVVNRSDEPLGGGTLSVHVDDASGMRSQVGEATIGATPPGLTSEAGVVVDASLEGIGVTVVYQGALGGEANAVIGKVQGPAAVEQIFRGLSDWMLRTATGIFPLGLGLPPTGPAVVKWGDVDNTIVTQNFFGVLDMRFQAYRINRAEGSRTVPLAASPLTTAGAVDLIPLGNPVTLGPTPIDLGTTWNDRRTVDYEQFIVDLVDDSNGVISLLGMESGYATQLDSSRSLRLAMPVDDQSPDYDWTLLDFALNRAGEVVGLVYVVIGTPPSVSVPVRRHRLDGTIADVPGVLEFVDFYTGLRDHCWFIVNLSRRTVLGRTCGDTAGTVVTSFAKRSGRVFYDLQYPPGWAPLLEVAPREDAKVIGDVSTTFGVTSVGRGNVYRPEWTAQGYGAVQLSSVVSSGLVGLGGVAVRTIAALSEVAVVTVLGEMQRSDGPAEGYTVLAAEGRFLEETESVQGWQWRPLTGGLIPLAALSVPAPHWVFVTTHLVDANRTAGMFLTNVFTSPRQRETRLVSPARELVFSGALQSHYDLLEPGLLYGLRDLRFHRQTQALEGLASPDLLAAGGPTAGAYHVVGRR